MTDISERNFAFLTIYLIPGFVVVASLAPHSPIVQSWLGVSSRQSPTVGGFLYVTLASVAAGNVVSIIRWLVVDAIHHRTGVARPDLQFADFQAKRAAFVALVENHYRYAQGYGNLLVALMIASLSFQQLRQLFPVHPTLIAVALILLMIILFIGSRDALRKYYERTASPTR